MKINKRYIAELVVVSFAAMLGSFIYILKFPPDYSKECATLDARMAEIDKNIVIQKAYCKETYNATRIVCEKALGKNK